MTFIIGWFYPQVTNFLLLDNPMFSQQKVPLKIVPSGNRPGPEFQIRIGSEGGVTQARSHRGNRKRAAGGMQSAIRFAEVRRYRPGDNSKRSDEPSFGILPDGGPANEPSGAALGLLKTFPVSFLFLFRDVY